MPLSLAFHASLVLCNPLTAGCSASRPLRVATRTELFGHLPNSLLSFSAPLLTFPACTLGLQTARQLYPQLGCGPWQRSGQTHGVAQWSRGETCKGRWGAGSAWVSANAGLGKLSYSQLVVMPLLNTSHGSHYPLAKVPHDLIPPTLQPHSSAVAPCTSLSGHMSFYLGGCRG